MITQVKKHSHRHSVFTGKRKPQQNDPHENLERAAVVSYLEQAHPDIHGATKKLTRYGKLQLENMHTLQSRAIEADRATNSATRYYRWFEV